jgi:hypothetical protein
MQKMIWTPRESVLLLLVHSTMHLPTISVGIGNTPGENANRAIGRIYSKYSRSTAAAGFK